MTQCSLSKSDVSRIRLQIKINNQHEENKEVPISKVCVNRKRTQQNPRWNAEPSIPGLSVISPAKFTALL